ncbi:MAG: phage tail protein [Marmoricola sp.]
MALPEIDTSVGHSFGLEVDGVFSTRLTEVTGLKMERDVVEVKEDGPDGTAIVRKLPGRWKTPEVTLTRGLTSDNSFAKWVKDSQPGGADGILRNGAITVFDRAGALIEKYLFTKAWPKSLEISTTFDAGSTPTLRERLVLVCERIEPA